MDWLKDAHPAHNLFSFTRMKECRRLARLTYQPVSGSPIIPVLQELQTTMTYRVPSSKQVLVAGLGVRKVIVEGSSTLNAGGPERSSLCSCSVVVPSGHQLLEHVIL